MDLQAHPVANIFPVMDEAEYAGLVADIRANGLREPIWLHQGQIIDGRNRYRACRSLGIEPLTRTWDGKGSLVAFVVSLNIHRRHLTSGQRAIVALDIEQMLATEAKQRQRAAGGDRGNQHTTKPKPVAAVEPKAKTSAAVVERIPQAPKPSPKPTEDKARTQAAKLLGVNDRYVQDAKKIQQQAPELLEKVKAGELTLPQARMEVKRQEKRQELQARAEAVKEAPQAQTWEVRVGDCIQGMRALGAGCTRLVFADPPYNVGIDYGDGTQADSLPPAAFVQWLGEWIGEAHRILTEDGSLWVLISDEYAAECCVEIKRAGFTLRNWVKWYEGFGVNCTGKFNRCTRHLFHAVKSPSRFVFHQDAVSRPSDRQVKYNDARANPAGKLLDDCWFDIPRLAGTHTERVPDFPTQLPIALLTRIVTCATDPGDLVVDPFNGSGTTGVACIRTSRRYLGFELRGSFAEVATLRLKGEK